MAKKEEKNIKDKTSFIKSFRAELKKVTWPTPKQLFNNTAAVLTIVIITAIVVFILDFAFESMNKYGIDKIKNVVVNSVTDEKIDNDDVTIDLDDESSETEENSEETVVEDETTDNNAE